MRWLADENFKHAILRGLRRRSPDIDIVRVQDTGLSGKSDPDLLAWAAEEGRLLLTHDYATMPGHAYQRFKQGLPMVGVVQVDPDIPVGLILEQILILDACSTAGEWEGQVIYLPLR